MSSSPASIPGLIIAAPASSSGKTTVTLGLLRALRRRGRRVTAAKVGPDYIDPAFHRAATGRVGYNLDTRAMRPTTLAAALEALSRDSELILAEGMMGLFDGAPDGRGSAADLARITGWPVLLVVDAGAMAASAAALVFGFARFDPKVRVVGVVFNRVGGPGHTELLRQACAPLGIPILGGLPHDRELVVPERHLGLVQAGEHPALEAFVERAAQQVEQSLDIDRVPALAEPSQRLTDAPVSPPLPPLGQHIAVARDPAFAFCYPLILDGWQRAGAALSFFSPLADDTPDDRADAIHLPGGYPELHAGRLAANRRCMAGLRSAAERGVTIYGECGGYMVLGRTLIDAEGIEHPMAGLLPITTSFAEPALHIGYRQLTLVADGPLGAAGQTYQGHEFHAASALSGDGEAALFRVSDAAGRVRDATGARHGTVMGSFIHLIDRTR